jgi:hypothetical protein
LDYKPYHSNINSTKWSARIQNMWRRHAKVMPKGSECASQLTRSFMWDLGNRASPVIDGNKHN